MNAYFGSQGCLLVGDAILTNAFNTIPVLKTIVSTKAVPDGLRAVNKLLPKIDPYQESKVLVKATKAQQEINATLIAPRPKNNNTDESMLKGHQNDLDQDPVEKAVEDLSTLDDDANVDVDTNGNAEETNESRDRSGTHELRRQRSEGDISLSTLAERLRAVEAEIGLDRRGVRSRRQQQQQDASHQDSKANNAQKGTSNSGAGALEKIKSGSTFRVFWEGIKENLGFGTKGKGSKILVAVLVIAIFGSSLAKFKRR